MNHHLQRLTKASFIVFSLLRVCDAFMSSSIHFSQTKQYKNRHHDWKELSSSSPSSLNMLEATNDIATLNTMDTMSTIHQSTFLIAETAEWRQYVVLFVVVGVLLDIVLGSPLANIALAPMRRAAEKSDVEEGGASDGMKEGGIDGGINAKKAFARNPRERVDSEAIGQEALQKARYSMELRQFLEENKTDKQRYEEMMKKIDAEAAAFDSRKKEL